MRFSDEETQKTIGNFLRRAESSNIEDAVISKRLDISRQIIERIHQAPVDWESRCSFNIKHIGNGFIDELRDVDFSKPSVINSIYTGSYRFLCEFDFLVGEGRELNFELAHLKQAIKDDYDEMDGHLRSQITYASYLMPASITKDFINDKNIGIFGDFEQTKSDAATLKANWDSEIEIKKAEVDDLKDQLVKYKTGFNFVGLSSAFANMEGEKKKEATALFKSLRFMGVVMILPLMAAFVIAVFGDYDGTKHLFILLPLISMEVILIYFFRVILINHKSVKAQLMQLELRQALCQFIQSYAEYSSKIKEQDSAALEKFENLIFSGILANSEKLPSTFDGIEQLGGFIKSMKSSS